MHCLLRQKLVELGAIPVRVRYRILWAGCNQELVAVVRIRIKKLPFDVMIKAEAAFESAGNRSVVLLPTAPFCEGFQGGKIIALGQAVQQKVCEWSG